LFQVERFSFFWRSDQTVQVREAANEAIRSVVERAGLARF
jgi:hypothetical protein